MSKTRPDVDEEIDESFPASDPPSHNPGTAAPHDEKDDPEKKERDKAKPSAIRERP